jgi:hypothetical protein
LRKKKKEEEKRRETAITNLFRIRRLRGKGKQKEK